VRAAIKHPQAMSSHGIWLAGRAATDVADIGTSPFDDGYNAIFPEMKIN
jgi:hypothetical protein